LNKFIFETVSSFNLTVSSLVARPAKSWRCFGPHQRASRLHGEYPGKAAPQPVATQSQGLDADRASAALPASGEYQREESFMNFWWPRYRI
jgi:hypothetical protein